MLKQILIVGIIIITSCNKQCIEYSDYFLCEKHTKYLSYYSPLLDSIKLEYHCVDNDSSFINNVYQSCLDICYSIPEFIMLDTNILDCSIQTQIEKRNCSFSVYKEKGASTEAYKIISEYIGVSSFDSQVWCSEKSGFSDKVSHNNTYFNKVFFITRKLRAKGKSTITINLFVKTDKSKEISL